MAFGHHLNLDVPELLHVALRVHRAVAKGRPGLPAGRYVSNLDLVFSMDHAHSLAPAPGASLYDQRIADLSPYTLDLRRAPAQAFTSRGDGDTRGGSHSAGGGFISHAGYHGRGGTEKFYVAGLADLREAGVLGQKAVAGVDGIRARELGGGDNGGNIKVATRSLRWPDADRLVRQEAVQGV